MVSANRFMSSSISLSRDTICGSRSRTSTMKRGREIAVIVHFWCPWIVIYWKTVLLIVIVVHFVKHELPKFSIVYMYIKDQLKKQRAVGELWE